MSLPITTLTICLLTLLFIFLSFRVIKFRRKFLVSRGDGGEKLLSKAIRAQGNCAEYVPLYVLLLLIAEIQEVSEMNLAFFSILFVLGRILHALGLSGEQENFRFRVTGMSLTFIGILAVTIRLIVTLF